jgi:hypothetical protein
VTTFIFNYFSFTFIVSKNKEMKTPTWATTIGIIMIVLGGCSVMNDIKSIRLPADLEKGMAIMKEERDKSEKEKDSVVIESHDSLWVAEQKEVEDDSVTFGNHKESIEKFLELTPFTKTWIVRFGYIGLLASAFYILGGVFLLVKRNFSIKLAYTVLAISILTSGAQAAVLTSGSATGVIALTTGLAQLAGVIIDIILLAVIFSSDKEAYAIDNLL